MNDPGMPAAPTPLLLEAPVNNTQSLWNAMTSAPAAGPVHDVTDCTDCDTAAAAWKAAHAAWWATRQGPRPDLSPFCCPPLTGSAA